MANLEFCDKQNMVAYLKKPTGSEGFHEIVYFLNGSHIRFALTKNPTIYVSLIEKFWQTATVRTVDNREQEITATFDGKEFIITEHNRFLNPHNRKYIAPTLTPKVFSNMKRGFSGEHTPLFPSMLAIQAEEGEGLVSHYPIVPDECLYYEEWDDRVERATTTAASLDAAQASGGSLGCKKHGGVHCSGLGLRGKVESLEEDSSRFKQTKQNLWCCLYQAYHEDDDEDLEDSSKQGRMIEEIDQDAGVTLVTPTHSQEDQPEDQLFWGGGEKKGEQSLVAAKGYTCVDAAKNVYIYTRRRMAISTGSGGVSTASRLFSTFEESVSTAGASMSVSTVGIVQEVNKDKGIGSNTSAAIEEDFPFNELKALFETTMRRVQTFHPIESEGDKTVPELTTGSSKRDAEVELDHEDPLVWRLYDTCGVHHVSSVRGHDIFMLVEKDYPLSKGVLMLMCAYKLDLDDNHKFRGGGL
ncbi:hypothetical protein Tco_0710252 [Tanacetum coccineum]